MKTHLHPSIVIVVFFACLVSCSKDQTSAKLAFSSFKSEGIHLKALDNLSYTFDSATMVLENIVLYKMILDDLSFETIEDSANIWNNLGKTSESFHGPYNIDIISGISIPEIDTIAVDPGMYYSIESLMGKSVGDSISFYLKGSVSKGLEEIGFEFKHSHSVGINMKNPEGFDIEENELNLIWINIDLFKVFEGVELHAATFDIDNVVRINNDSNADLLYIIIQNLEANSKIGMNKIVGDFSEN